MDRSSRAPVSLLPIFRSEAQYRLIGELFTTPAERTIGELAALTGVSHTTVSREVARLTEAGLVRSRGQGRRRLVAAATDTPVFAPLRELLSKTYGVPAVIREEFGHLDGRVSIFGSYAARWAGDPGPSPGDVDLLVVGSVDPTEAWEAAARATSRLGIEVNVVVRSPEEWENDRTGFAEELRRSPTIDVSDGGATPGVPGTDGSIEGEGR